MNTNTAYVIGVELGTDSARALLANAITGQEIDTEVAYYPRWMKGLYTDKSISQFRHHPQDYIDTLSTVISAVCSRNPEEAALIKAVALDTTGSTLCLTDKEGTPLALKEEFKDDPNAMFVIWKDHTGQKESDEINSLLAKQPINYSMYTGNDYSAECFWAKVLHLLRVGGESLRNQAYSAIEICDYIPSLLTGNKVAEDVKVGHCVAGAKWMWAEKWGGYPPTEFFEQLDPILLPILSHLPKQNYNCDSCAGLITGEWAKKLGLPLNTPIGVGNIDSHSGAVGGGIEHGTMVMNLGTSACFMSVEPVDKFDKIVDGVFGQVDGSILKGMYGFEIGLSSFGDTFDWYKNLLAWPLKNIVAKMDIDEKLRGEIVEKGISDILKQLGEEAELIDVNLNTPLATDWLNGRRSPFTNTSLTGSLVGLDLSSTAPLVYYAFAESTAFATKVAIQHMEKYGVKVDRLIGIGGIAQKSPFVMQLFADVVGKRLEISDCKQAGAMGAVIHAATVAGIYPTVTDAQKALCKPASKYYDPRPEKAEILEQRYQRYLKLGKFTEYEL